VSTLLRFRLKGCTQEDLLVSQLIKNADTVGTPRLSTVQAELQGLVYVGVASTRRLIAAIVRLHPQPECSSDRTVSPRL